MLSSMIAIGRFLRGWTENKISDEEVRCIPDNNTRTAVDVARSL